MQRSFREDTIGPPRPADSGPHRVAHRGGHRNR
jgi:hypothetical protein